MSTSGKWGQVNMTDGSGNNANYYGRPYPIDSNKYFTTVVGEFQNSDSPYGTFDQGGNLWEFNETIINANNENYRGLRGGLFECVYGSQTDAKLLLAAFRCAVSTGGGRYFIGFRVVAVPEPATLSLLALGAAVLLRRRVLRTFAGDIE